MRFQDKIRKFVVDTFGIEIADNKEERCHRFAEESMELLQAAGYTKEQLLTMIDYVYNREIGDVKKEVGGVMATLAALASVFDVDIIKQAGTEARKAIRNAQFIKLKHNGKPLNIKAGILNQLQDDIQYDTIDSDKIIEIAEIIEDVMPDSEIKIYDNNQNKLWVSFDDYKKLNNNETN